jgi:hypothetical protein
MTTTMIRLTSSSSEPKECENGAKVDRAGFEPAASASFCPRACEGGIHARLNYRPITRLKHELYLTLLNGDSV